MTEHLDPLMICGTFASLMVAKRSGLLKSALERMSPPADHAQRLGLDARVAESILDVLVAAGLVYKRGDLYGIPPDAPVILRRSLGLVDALNEDFSHTLRALETGKPLEWLDNSLEERAERYQERVVWLAELYAEVAGTLAERLALQPARILDVGCGAGVWSLAIAARTPGAHVTGLDLPGVVGSFQQHAASLDLADRAEALAGDMFSVPLPHGHFDLIVLANVLRIEAPSNAERLVARLAALLPPRGRILIIDALAGGTTLKNLGRAAYALHLGLRTKRGRVHSVEQITSWLRSAGLARVVPIDCELLPMAIGALLAERD